jgi:hypothetical protein
VNDLAVDYDLSAEEIEQAVLYERAARASSSSRTETSARSSPEFWRSPGPQRERARHRLTLVPGMTAVVLTAQT